MPKLARLLAERLSARIKEGRLTKVEVSQAAGIDRPKLDRYLEGHIPGIETVEKIAEAVGIDADELVTLRRAPDRVDALLSDLTELLAIFPKLDDIGREAVMLAARHNLEEARAETQKPPSDSSGIP